jgi:hypothetical protein
MNPPRPVLLQSDCTATCVKQFLSDVEGIRLLGARPYEPSLSGSGSGGIMPMPMGVPSGSSSTTTSMVLPFSRWLTAPAMRKTCLPPPCWTIWSLPLPATYRSEAERHRSAPIGSRVQAQDRSLS